MWTGSCIGQDWNCSPLSIGAADKTACSIPEEGKIRPSQLEPMCKPIAQAMLLNQQGIQFNIALGLCVGHDSMFYKYSDALVTTLVVKDRVMGLTPAALLLCRRLFQRHTPVESKIYRRKSLMFAYVVF